jgi:hypothetical protein
MSRAIPQPSCVLTSAYYGATCTFVCGMWTQFMASLVCLSKKEIIWRRLVRFATHALATGIFCIRGVWTEELNWVIVRPHCSEFEFPIKNVSENLHEKWTLISFWDYFLGSKVDVPYFIWLPAKQSFFSFIFIVIQIELSFLNVYVYLYITLYCVSVF